MVDSCFDEDPWVRENVARGRAEGALQPSKRMLTRVVRLRFPSPGQATLERQTASEETRERP